MCKSEIRPYMELRLKLARLYLAPRTPAFAYGPVDKIWENKAYLC
jgi:hypothetical protein